MKFTLSWLKSHLETSHTLAQLCQILTAIGLEVESVLDPALALAAFTVAEIREAEPHPNADKLRVCQVDDGAAIRQIVCGAPNARAGIKVALAKEGVTIPASGIVIKKTAIRGVESNGMLCSARELGISDEDGGIIELPAQAKIGAGVADTLGLGDPVIDIAVTPNRADCLSVRGIARDLAAAGLGTLKDVASGAKGTGKSPLSVTLATPACPLFVGCLIRGVTNGPSPLWLQQWLKAIGLRPISALVDITNFMTIGYGRPLHVFDAAALQGNITVRYAQPGETLLALNDKEYTLTPDMVAVCDAAGVIGLGGIIGGKRSGCSETTTDVFLEAALFDPAAIARTGRALGIESDARYRFERGVDPAFVETGASIALAMILELCGGSASEFAVMGAVPAWQRSIRFNPAKVESLGGLKLADEKINAALRAVGCRIEGAEVTPPSWRADIACDADLVEEVLRIAGYDAIAATALPRFLAKPAPSPQATRLTRVRKTLAVLGLTEICSWAFLPQRQAEQFGGGSEALRLINPISAELDTMRPNLLPNLISAAQRNEARGFADMGLFEIGNVFADATPQGQKTMAAAIRCGQTAARNPFKTGREVDIFDAKADLFALLEAGGLNPAKLTLDRNVPAWYHPTRSGRVSLGGKITLGFFGELHPLILNAFDSKQRMVAFEAFLEAIPLPKSRGKAKALLQVSNFQAVERDFAFIAGERLSASEMIKAVEAAEKQLIRNVSVFDIYAGKGVEPGKKSVAISVTLQAPDRTLSEAEIEAAAQNIIAAASALGLSLRR